MGDGERILATLLRHEAKSNSYKFALVRALNDLALARPAPLGEWMVVPLRMVAQRWLVHYWAFCGPQPVWQGPRATRDGQVRQDMTFRPLLTRLRIAWEMHVGVPSTPADGALFLADWESRRHLLSPEVRTLAEVTLRAIAKAVRQPLQFAGPGAQHSLFSAPRRAAVLLGQPLPGTRPEELAFVVPGALWQSLTQMNLWVEALCVHEWSVYVERVQQVPAVGRGEAFTLLTHVPPDRVSVAWERNQVRAMMGLGVPFHCPWTNALLTSVAFDMDHVIPVSALPFNDLWNVVPTLPSHNQHVKRARLPRDEDLMGAVPRLAATYAAYDQFTATSQVFGRDVRLRFGSSAGVDDVARQVAALASHVAAARNVPRYKLTLQ